MVREVGPTAAPAPGESLMVEHARRVKRRRQAARSRSWWARVRYRLSTEPASTRAFALGAEGERIAAARMAREGDPVIVLHSRGLGPGGRRGDIDHLAVCPSGVVVVDAKHYRGARVQVRATGGLMTPRRQQLMVRGRDRTSLLVGTRTQRDVVAQALAGPFPDVPVSSVLCFVDGEVVRSGQSIDGTDVVASRRVRRRLLRDGPLDAAARAEIAAYLDRTFPAARS
ncbi:MAG: nuclease-related domain-containing protein [Nocardioidaceae bacterium]|nr:nuclease-related domain-containing protein [Nocardioidaceae bacterium]